jgi:DNA-binding XRE family transcriptional regulator
MTTTLKDKMAALGKRRRQRIEARAAELIAEEMSLRELRRAHRLTQERIGESLGIGQEGVSRLEKRSDLLLSTLRSYVEAMGGHLQLVAEFPDRPPVVLSGLAAMETRDAAARRARPHKTGDRGTGADRRAS